MKVATVRLKRSDGAILFQTIVSEHETAVDRLSDEEFKHVALGKSGMVPWEAAMVTDVEVRRNWQGEGT